jgi:hypothetical protein
MELDNVPNLKSRVGCSALIFHAEINCQPDRSNLNASSLSRNISWIFQRRASQRSGIKDWFRPAQLFPRNVPTRNDSMKVDTYTSDWPGMFL